MSPIATNAWERPWRPVFSVTLAVFLSMLGAPPGCTAQTLRKGVSVRLAVTRNAVAMPDADKDGSLIVAVTHSGRVYFGIDPITPAALAEKRGLSPRPGERLYIKVDARTPYANVAEVLSAVRKAGVTAPNLLTGQPEAPEPGKLLVPKGLEVLVGPPLPPATESIVIHLFNSGERHPRLKINQKDVPWANLESALGQLSANQSKRVVLVSADGLLPFDDVVHVIDMCRLTGANVYLVTPAT